MNISMRAPADAPQAIKDALAVSDVERNGDSEHVAYSLREGAYYGNIFSTTPGTLDASGKFVPSTSGTSGTTASVIEETPAFYACAGPGSNIPEVTKRFCSSQGDQAVISVPGVCLGTAAEPGTCSGEDTDPASPTFGAIGDCYTAAGTTTDSSGNVVHKGQRFKEVITVYLQQPISVCGNEVCEDGEGDATTRGYCPSDCHPGWAKSFNVNFGSAGITLFDFSGTSALSPPDDGIVFAGLDLNQTDVSLGGDVLPAGTGETIVAKYASDGTYLWGTRFHMSANRVSVAVANDGTIAVAGWPSLDGGLVGLAKLSRDGTLLSGWPLSYGTLASGTANGKMALDSAGNVFLAGVYTTGTATFATTPPKSFTADTDSNVFVLKVRPDGTLAWADSVGGAGADFPNSLALDASGDLLFAADLGESTTFAASTALFRISSSIPSSAPDQTTSQMTALRTSPSWDPHLPLPSTRVYFSTLAADRAGELYVTGDFHGTYDFGPGCGTATASAKEFFLVKYSADGSQCRWLARATTQCPADADYCQGLYEGGALAFDPDGNVVVGGRLDSLNGAYIYGVNGASLITARRGGTVDFGAGPFDNYFYPDAFVASYGSDGSFRWAKQLPMVLQGNLRGLSVDSQGRIVVSGTYTGSLEVDDRLIVNPAPEFLGNNHANTFLASLAPLSPLGATPPAIGGGADQTGTSIDTVPGHIFTEATSSAGAVVFFMPPTAIDNGSCGGGQCPPGVSVDCLPRPNSTFPIGTTTVNCTATDAFGKSSSASFMVTVEDTLGPMITGDPATTTVEATGPGGATAFAAPTATDQVDGSRPVTCTSAPGSTFSIGSTTVSCTSSDTRGNTSTETFIVKVTDTTPPVLTVPSNITVSAPGQSAAVVTFTASATDLVDGDVPVTCSPPSGASFPLGTTSVACTAIDRHGNSATAIFTVTVIGSPPTLTLPSGITATATSASGALVSYSVSAVDFTGAPLTPVCTPPSGSTFALGSTTVTCTATDGYGGTTTGSFPVQVAYAWSGILQPIDPDGNSLFKLGSTVAVKFQLTGASAGIANAVATLTVAKITSSVIGTDIEAVSTSAATTGNLFRYDSASGQYIFNLNTKPLSRGTWLLSIDLHDGVVRRVTISLK